MPDPFIDADIAMPHWLQDRRHELCEAARECYARRDTIAPCDPIAADDLETIGDVYLSRACAVLAEWASCTTR